MKLIWTILMSFFRLLLLLLVGLVVWLLLRPSSRKAKNPQSAERKEDTPETIAACAWCGVYVPESEMLTDKNGEKYCSKAHLALSDAKSRSEKH